MECPYCGSELRCEDSYGRGRQASFYGTAANGLYYPSTYEKLGYIYKCFNSCGFNTEEEATKYAKENNIKYEDWQDVVCDSDCFNGNFYTDDREELHEGYPC